MLKLGWEHLLQIALVGIGIEVSSGGRDEAIEQIHTKSVRSHIVSIIEVGAELRLRLCAGLRSPEMFVIGVLRQSMADMVGRESMLLLTLTLNHPERGIFILLADNLTIAMSNQEGYGDFLHNSKRTIPRTA